MKSCIVCLSKGSEKYYKSCTTCGVMWGKVADISILVVTKLISVEVGLTAKAKDLHNISTKKRSFPDVDSALNS